MTANNMEQLLLSVAERIPAREWDDIGIGTKLDDFRMGFWCL